MDYNLLSLLAGVGKMGGGAPGQLPRFQGGEGMDQNLLMLLMSQGMLPRHQNMSGEYILPSAPQPTYGFHSPSALDAFKAEGSMASRLGPYFNKPSYGADMTPEGQKYAAQAEMDYAGQQHDLLQQEQLQPTPAELQDMQRVRLGLPQIPLKGGVPMSPLVPLPKLKKRVI